MTNQTIFSPWLSKNQKLHNTKPPVLLFVLLRKCEMVYHKQFKRQIRNALHIQKNAAPTMCLNSNFMISFCLDNKMSLFQATKINTRHNFHCAWKPPTKKNSYFNPVKFSISRHGQFPKPSLLPLFVKVTGSLFQMTLIFQDNINIIPCKSKLKH